MEVTTAGMIVIVVVFPEDAKPGDLGLQFPIRWRGGDIMEDIGAVFMASLSVIASMALIIGYKLKKQQLEMGGSDSEVDALRDDLNDTRAQLAEMQERLGFTERLLGGGSEAQEDTSA